MIERLTIKNFRCFQHTALNNLARINLIVGKNGSGKTALLESIFIGNGNPELLLRIRAQRLGEGVGGVVSSQSDSLRPLISPLYHNFDTKVPIEITNFGVGINTVAKILYTESALKYEFQPKGQVGKKRTYKFTINPEGVLKISPPALVEHKLAFFASSIKHSPAEASRNFSEISKLNEVDEFVSALKIVLPSLEDLSIEIEGAFPMIFAKMKGIKKRLPIQFVSDGISRLLSILIGITTTSRGTILIDELENGIYHRAFPSVIAAIRQFANKYDVQLFITTHSKELLQAFADAAGANDDVNDFSLLRVEDGKVEQFGEASFRNAIEQDIEVR